MPFLEKIFKKDTTNPTKLNKQTLFYLFIIILACAKQLYGAQSYLDLPFFDESIYLKKGIQMQKHIFNDWGPAYNLWYFILSKLTGDAVKTFYLNYYLLTILIPVLLFLLLVRLNIKHKLALLLMLLFSTQPILISNFTYVSHFCIVIILAAFILTTYIKANEIKLVIVIMASYICMYTRQEFLLTTVSLVILWIALLLYQKKIKPSFVYIFLAILIIGFYFIFGFISFKAAGTDRSYFAFIQHFYVNYAIWTKKLLPLEQFNALDIFHGSKTMFQCLLANPVLFIKHLATNLVSYLLSLSKYIEDLILPKYIFHYLGKGKHILFLAFLFYLLYSFLKRKNDDNLFSFIRQYTFTCILIIIFFAWSFFSILFIFPERHYVIIQFSWWILLLAILLNNNAKWLDKPYIFYAVLILLLVFIPTSASIGYFHNAVADAKQQPYLRTINYLKKRELTTTQNIFTTETGFEAYLPENYHENFIEVDSLEPYKQNSYINIQKYLADKNVTIIFMNEKMQKLIEANLIKTDTIILNDPEKMGYKKEIIDKRLNTYLLIKE